MSDMRVYHRPGWQCNCGCPNGHWRTTCFRCAEPKPPKDRPRKQAAAS